MADESRIENILDATLGEPSAEVPSPPFSRIEEKLIELKEAIESGGGGGGGTTNYNDLTNKPSINGHPLQGNSTLDTLGIASKSTLDAAIEELELMETELDGKVDKETDKGLSTNDFTDTDKANLTIALTTANAAAPQSTTYNKTEVDAALAEKLNTADVDADLSSTSTNPVQNKAVQAPVARLVDAGAKNLLKLRQAPVSANTQISGTINNGVVSLSTSTAIAANSYVTISEHSFYLKAGKKYVISGCPGNGLVRLFIKNNSGYLVSQYGNAIEYTPQEDGDYDIIVYLYSGVNISNFEIRPMICTAEDYAISTEFVPYTPSNRELYEMILALQNAQNG